jgi:hypothetical protein
MNTHQSEPFPETDREKIVPGQRFALGMVVLTPRAEKAMEKAGITPASLLSLHSQGNWGGLSKEDRQLNELALLQQLRLLSSYLLSTGVTIWVITEADRSITTLLLPDEY